jgi:hypothetical protein
MRHGIERMLPGNVLRSYSSMLTIWREITRFSMRKYISCSINCILLLVQLS